MYGLKQAAILAYKQLVKHLATFGYAPVPFSLFLWKHNTRKTQFFLCVDDFGIKFYPKSNADHLIHALKEAYLVTVDWEGRNYCGYQLD